MSRVILLREMRKAQRHGAGAARDVRRGERHTGNAGTPFQESSAVHLHPPFEVLVNSLSRGSRNNAAGPAPATHRTRRALDVAAHDCAADIKADAGDGMKPPTPIAMISTRA